MQDNALPCRFAVTIQQQFRAVTSRWILSGTGQVIRGPFPPVSAAYVAITARSEMGRAVLQPFPLLRLNA